MPIKLTGEQQRVLFLPPENPIQIKGVAGSGKTTVSIYRARHLLVTYGDLFQAGRVAIFTYNKSLVKYMASLLVDAFGEAPDVYVTTFHKWAYQYLKQHNFWATHRVASTQELTALVTQAVAAARLVHPQASILTKTDEFFTEEVGWLKGKGIESLEQYIQTPRIGRGGADRVTQADKAVIWTVYTGYEIGLSTLFGVDFHDFARHALRLIEATQEFSPPFTHIVVDEAQDLDKVQMKTIARLVSPKTNSITIIADAAQRIYKSGFTWTEVGINVRGGRTVEFQHNYRNTREIAQAAGSLIAHDPNPAEFTTPIHPIRSGPAPRLIKCPNKADQFSRIRTLLADLSGRQQPIVILHRTRRELRSLQAGLGNVGIVALLIQDDHQGKLTAPGVYLCTMSSIKGLEYAHVIICDLNDDVIPYPPGFADANDDDHVCTERRLLYTSMTRATDTLTLMASAEPSRYLAEIDATFLSIEDHRHG